MSSKLAIVALFASFLGACAAESSAPNSSSQDRLKRETRGDVDGPTVCGHTNETACLADEGCAWGNQGKGSECFYVGPVSAGLPGPGMAQPPPGAGTPCDPVVGGPTVCSHHAAEAACLADDGCAWGNAGKGPECFFVGPVSAHRK